MELERSYADIRAQGAELLAISVDSLEAASEMQLHTNATFPILADHDHAVTAAYGLFDLLGDGVSAPATIILTASEIVGLSVGETMADRVPASAIIQRLREFNSEAPTTAS